MTIKGGVAMTGQGSQRGIVVILEGNRKKFCYNDTTSKILKRDRKIKNKLEMEMI
jgi:sugar-specific transcriptional regulator TrmB